MAACVGNQNTHFTKPNSTDVTRVSIDFRAVVGQAFDADPPASRVDASGCVVANHAGAGEGAGADADADASAAGSRGGHVQLFTVGVGDDGYYSECLKGADGVWRSSNSYELGVAH